MLKFDAMNVEQSPVTVLLQAWKGGDSEALSRLIPLVYDELRRMAASHLGREASAHTLQPTALVHEAYIRLAGVAEPDFRNRAHFRCVAARVMRQILVDRARARNTRKRDGGFRVELDDSAAAAAGLDAPFEALDDALANLERQDPEKARILELKYFGGLTAGEMVEVLGVGLNRINWQIRTAQAWLRRELESPTTPKGAADLA